MHDNPWNDISRRACARFDGMFAGPHGPPCELAQAHQRLKEAEGKLLEKKLELKKAGAKVKAAKEEVKWLEREKKKAKEEAKEIRNHVKHAEKQLLK
jgi:hypothetical protein